ncbi:hypothetical protein C8A00DRAFT_17854 [Chaetomidium leptoderma]|uniref:Uncharacterized protein n=1 Tax=Chaetomidium leptoderma TaxID=669021 RepID=A0AAN6VGH0_9PEZI|nr:hypothetical protein C8A00DRAFT_17854 [Chaetomidium leptoderma]
MAAMSHAHLSHLTAIDRPNSRVSLARSDTTYHSFQDIDLHEPGVSSGPAQKKSTVCPPPISPSQTEGQRQRPMAREMRRQDSGYESMAPRDSFSSHQRCSSSNSLSSSTRQRRPRPPNPRSPKSGPMSHRPRHGRHSVSPPGSSRSLSPQPQQPVTYFHFPHFTSSDPALVESEPAGDLHNQRDLISTQSFAGLRSEAPTPHPLPPQTTHYWTSDRTRRLEYAAIDAASKGVRGWVLRAVPDCFVPQSKRRIGFEDDRGSVVRYRLELDTEEGVEKTESMRMRGWRGWLFSTRRR